ncbi:MAG: hypothetical protein K2X87_12145 [Gemmataceae bacterium]|nr:hypothetical protein [Gemmataceae bacterium]
MSQPVSKADQDAYFDPGHCPTCGRDDLDRYSWQWADGSRTKFRVVTCCCGEEWFEFRYVDVGTSFLLTPAEAEEELAYDEGEDLDGEDGDIEDTEAYFPDDDDDEGVEDDD